MKRRRWAALGRGLATILLLGALRAGLATQPCPGEAGEVVPAQAEALRRLEAELAAQAQRCSDNALFLAYRGAVLLALGRAADAATWLELVLLHQPELPVAQIDYARALSRLGDEQGAAALWRAVLARPDLPPHLRQDISERLAASRPRPPSTPAGWRHRLAASLRTGYDSNLNAASSAREITLTLPGLGITLPIAEEAQPVDGAAVWFDGRWQAGRVLGGGREVDLRADLRLRTGVAVRGVGYRQADVEASLHQHIDGGAWSATLGGSDLQFSGDHLLTGMRLQLTRSWLYPACARRLGAEGELRRYPTSHVLDGQYFGLAASLSCRNDRFGYSLLGRAGIDEPRSEARPGGRQYRVDLRAQFSRDWFGGQAQVLLAWQAERDRDGYSPLLADGVRRQIHRSSLGAEWSRPVSGDWRGVVAVEAVEQRANISLFSLRSVSIRAGVSRDW